MNEHVLQRELRRRHNNSWLTVKRDRWWALKHGEHPDAWQVWDMRSQGTGEPYCIFVCSRGGLPAEPSEQIFELLYERWHERPGGMRSKEAVEERVQFSAMLGEARLKMFSEGFRHAMREEMRRRLRFEVGRRQHVVQHPTAADRILSKSQKRKVQKAMRLLQ